MSRHDPTRAGGSGIEGSVRDATTDEPLPGATVMLEGTSMGAATDLDGRFVIRDVPPSSYTVRITYVGYQTEEMQVRVGPDIPTGLEIKLTAAALRGKEVVVTAQASGQNAAINQQLSAMQITSVVSAAKIQELPDANAAESLGRFCQTRPSMVRDPGVP
ncbi:MAG TPA: DUF2012 domain-containing protein [Candidatus Kryptonia bacterium]